MKSLKFRQVTFSLFILLSITLFSETYVDSVYSIPQLDGAVAVTYDGNPVSVNANTYEMIVGDFGTEGSFPTNSFSHSFLSFELPILPEDCHIDSIVLRMYQIVSYGNGGWEGFPFWDVPNGDTIKCIVSHIDYGNELGFDDFEKGDIGNPFTYNHNIGMITRAGMDSVTVGWGEKGYRFLNVTESVQLDYDNNRDLSQYRIAFEIDTDFDNLYDNLSFATYETYEYNWDPKLFFYYNTDVSNEEAELNSDFIIEITPNPVRDICYIYFEAKRRGTYSIELFNIKGQKIISSGSLISQRGNNNFSFGTENLQSGVYFMKFKNNVVITTKKITITH